jgi:uncharacterized membrane protein
MNRRLIVILSAWAAVLLWAAADLAYHYPRLPESVAVHFNVSGVPDRWSPKSEFLTTWVVLLLVLAGLFAGLRVLLRFLPAGCINLPRREYWLAPERAAYTRAVVGDLVLALGVVILASISALNHVMLRANLRENPDLGLWPWLIMATTLVVIAPLLVWVTRRFFRYP